jgi:hypothetical protein
MMKNRLVLWINIAVYAFSVLVLILSAVSFFFPTEAGCYHNFSRTQVLFLKGRIVVNRIYKDTNATEPGFYGFNHRFVAVPESHASRIEYFSHHPEGVVKERLGIRWVSFPRHTGKRIKAKFPEHIFVMPIQILLIPPIIWMSGFWLVKLLRHVRKRSVSFQPDAPCVPSE